MWLWTRKRYHDLYAAAIAVVLAASVGGAAAAGSPAAAGTVLTLRGDCSAVTAGARRSLQTGAAVNVGDVVETGVEARMKIKMIDGSVLSVASSSKLTIADYDNAAGGKPREVEIDLDHGLLRAVVTHMDAPARFDVDTPAGVAAVRGTDWFVAAGPDKTQVGVLTGKVSLTSNATHHSVDIPAHWGARLELGKDPVPPRRWKASEFQDVIDKTDIN
jgi:hypothetical protein